MRKTITVSEDFMASLQPFIAEGLTHREAADKLLASLRNPQDPRADEDATPASFKKPCTWFPDADCPIGNLDTTEIIKACGKCCPLLLDFKASLRKPSNEFTSQDQIRHQRIQRKFYPQTV
ncbi:MAG: hypothetical protein HYU39_00085, partial [Thaumarchaeota archaeon]|nr:hypothetical protein [Nitrososphaerota archaeon]